MYFWLFLIKKLGVYENLGGLKGTRGGLNPLTLHKLSTASNTTTGLNYEIWHMAYGSIYSMDSIRSDELYWWIICEHWLCTFVSNNCKWEQPCSWTRELVNSWTSGWPVLIIHSISTNPDSFARCNSGFIHMRRNLAMQRYFRSAFNLTFFRTISK